MKEKRSEKIDCGVILCAGFGKRFKPISERIPKPAIPFLNKPMVCWNVEQLISFGIRKIFVNLHHLPEKIIESLKSYQKEAEIRYSYEETLLGTYGLFSKFKEELSDIFFVLNSDFFLKLPLRELEEKIKTQGNLECVLTVKKRKGDESYTTFKKEMDKITEIGCGDHFFIGLYAARKAFLSEIYDIKRMELTDVLKEKINNGVVGCLETHRTYFDLGTLKTFLNANEKALNLMLKNKIPIPNGNRLIVEKKFILLKHINSYIDESTYLSGFVVVGENSRIERDSVVKNCVLLPNAVINKGSVIEDSVIFSSLTC